MYLPCGFVDLTMLFGGKKRFVECAVFVVVTKWPFVVKIISDII